jgi:hypothetical protein
MMGGAARCTRLLNLADAPNQHHLAAAIDMLDRSTLQVIGGWLLVVLISVLREVAAGALKEAGKDLWGWVRRQRP